jgi:nucleotide-binding universal stress UspA family protein
VFERILVTLDGSIASEAALPAATAIAEALGSTLILAHIVEARPPRTVHGEPHLAEALSAAAYLEQKAAELRARGLSVETHVHETPAAAGPDGPDDGAPGTNIGVAQRGIADAIAAHTAELGFDLAVMAVHGKRGAGDWLASSLPFRVAAAGCAPVYLVRAPRDDGSGPAWQPPRSIMLPLDGKAEHEAAVSPATALALAFRIPVEVLGVVPKRSSDSLGGGAVLGRLNPALDRASLDYAAKGTETYLSMMASRLSSDGVEASWGLVRGRPTRVILGKAAEERALVVLSTNRKLGVDAALDGCVSYAVATAYEGDSLVAPIARCGAD